MDRQAAGWHTHQSLFYLSTAKINREEERGVALNTHTHTHRSFCVCVFQGDSLCEEQKDRYFNWDLCKDRNLSRLSLPDSALNTHTLRINAGLHRWMMKKDAGSKEGIRPALNTSQDKTGPKTTTSHSQS